MTQEERVAALEARLARKERELQAVHQIAAALHARVRLDDLVCRTLVTAIDVAQASAGSILLHDPERDRLVFRYVVGASPEITEQLVGQEMPVDQGLAGHVFTTGRGCVSGDVQRDSRHYHRIEESIDYTTENMVIAPLKSTGGRVIGVLEVLNRLSGAFDADDLAVLEILSGHAASAIETASLHDQILRTRREKEQFLREVVRCVTHDRLRLVDYEEVPEEGRLQLDLPLDDSTAYADLRGRLLRIAEQQGLPGDAATDLTLAAGEAVTNAIKHGAEGRVLVYLAEDRIIVRVSDRGPGIRPENLPATLFSPGFSTQVSLGMGYTIMLRVIERVWLATGSEGTIVQLEKLLHPPDGPEVLPSWLAPMWGRT